MPQALAPVRVLVCGGRTWGVPPADALPADIARAEWQQQFTARKLDALHARRPISLLIHGAAAGADTLAHVWAETRRVPVQACPADWDRYGKRAGRIRNLWMLTEFHPELVVAFPGGAGTAHMVEVATLAGVQVWRPAVPSVALPTVRR
jgi:hypothetical protein